MAATMATSLATAMMPPGAPYQLPYIFDFIHAGCNELTSPVCSENQSFGFILTADEANYWASKK